MTDKQDVVLVTFDSLRADHCGFMGYDEDVTPTLDTIAEEGLVFENAIAPAPETNSSVSTMLTGQYSNPDLEADLSSYTERTRHHMRTRRTLPQRFQEMGYETAAFTANPWTSRYFNFDRDFDHFEDTMDENLSSEIVKDGSNQGFTRDLVVQLLNWWQGQNMFLSWDSLYDEIESWMSSATSPYFCWIFLVDVHMPYIPPKEHRSRSRLLNYPANMSLFVGKWNLSFQSIFHDVLVDSYDDSIRYTDDFIDRLLTDLDRYDQDPLVAITSDHGEEFGEHGMYGHGPKLNETSVHVPFVVHNGPTGTVERPFSLRQLPELLPALATDQSYEDLLESTVWTRNYDPAIVIRGKEWRYEWRPEETQLAVRVTDSWEQRDLPELEAIGEDLVEYHLEAERERGRILDAVSSVVSAEAV